MGRAAARQVGACPSSSKSKGRRPTRERGRPARMHCRIVPLSFPAIRHPATLPARTPWAGLRPGKPARAPSSSKSDGRRPTRERGRPARMHCRIVPLSFPAMGHPATLPPGTVWVRPKQKPGPVAGRSRSRRSPRLCQDLCGRDARAPGWACGRLHQCLERKWQRGGWGE